MKDEKVLKMFMALKRISKYQTLDNLRRESEKDYGLSYEEVLEMAYDNVIQEAKSAIKGARPPSLCK